MLIENLQLHRECIPVIARWHFEPWGPLTGAKTLHSYTRLLEAAAKSSGIPSVLVALLDDVLVGSVSLVASDMSIRPALTPWLAQLFVAPEHRRKGIGMALVRAASDRIRSFGFRWLYLYTSGGLAQYYEKLGWKIEERVEYLGDERTVMRHDLFQDVK
jgi:GNAT superfamily N-acetyltransferase